MSIDRALTIDELYAAVEDVDVVLSSDAPLTLGLDRRVSRPRIGRLAATPRSHATGDLVPSDERSLFFALNERTAMPWKQSVRALDLCLDCWNRTGDIEAILQYPEFDSEPIRKTVSCLQDVSSSYLAVASQSIAPETRLTVVDEERLTALDRSLLPDAGEYDTVSPFGDGTWSLPDVHLYPSATAIVDDLVDTLDAVTADQVGIVLDQSSIYSPLIEAALDAAEIPHEGGPTFIDDDAVRKFVRLLQGAFSGGGLTVGELRPLLVAIGLDVPRDQDNQRLEHVSGDWTDQFDDLRERIRSGTFRQALDAFSEVVPSVSDSELATFRAELEELNLLRSTITADRVDELTYYLRSFEVPVEREREGVLLADAGSTAYVDRPVVFYLGLGDGWARTPPDYPWIDSEQFLEQDMRRFKILIQNGQQQHFLVQDSMSGETVTPCVYIRELLDTSFDGFADLPHIEHRSTIPSPSDCPFDAPPASTPDPIETVSQSTVKRLVNCPRDHYFNRLVDSPESLPMARGTGLHEAAELYVNHPSFVDDNRERVLDAMCDQLQPYLSDIRREVLRTRLNAGLAIVTRYLDANPPTDATFETYGEPKGENDLADRLGLDVDSPLCERWFQSTALGGHGYVDLLNDSQTVVDYKTGGKKSASRIQTKARLDPIEDKPDFQVLLYLAQHRRERPGETIRLKFVYLLEAIDEWVNGVEPPLDDLVTTITYVPCSFSEFVARREVFDQLCETKYQQKILEKLGYDWYRSFFETHDLPREGVAPDERERIKTAFNTKARAEIGDYAYVGDATDGIFSKLETTPDGYYLEDDIDAFEAFLDARIDELNDYRGSRFPVSFDETDDPTWDRVDHRDLILTDR